MAKSGNKKSLFWTSYSDLMTSLFFAMLVLFVVVVVAMGSANSRVKVLNDQLNKAMEQLKAALDSANVTIEQQNQILKLQEQFQTLTTSTSLDYDIEKRMFYVPQFQGVEIFEPDKDIIKENFIPVVDNVGNDIKRVIDNLTRDNKTFKYQLVIEGTAAIPFEELRAHTYNADNAKMYELSYRRALALYNRWKHLGLRNGNTEVIIAGSGFNGINRDEINEDNNKRFVIQIIPKIEKPSN